MRVYAETNFVLEIALLQEQHESCESLLALAQQKAIYLLIPSFSLAEPISVIARNGKNRNELSNKLITEVKQLARTETYRLYKENIESIRGLLAQSQQEEINRFISTYSHLLDIAQFLEMNELVLRSAMDIYNRFGLHLQDSIIFASILLHLEQNKPKHCCFINRNRQDFSNSDIINLLEQYGCHTIFSFDGGLHHVQQVIDTME